MQELSQRHVFMFSKELLASFKVPTFFCIYGELSDLRRVGFLIIPL